MQRLQWLQRLGSLTISIGMIAFVLVHETRPVTPVILALAALLFAIVVAADYSLLDLVLRHRQLAWWQYGLEGALLGCLAFAFPIQVDLAGVGLPDLPVLVGVPAALFLDMKLHNE